MLGFELEFILVAVCVFLASMIWYQKNLIQRKGCPPGPLELPIMGNMIQVSMASSYPFIAFDKLSKKYGPIMSVKIGAIEAIVISESDTIKELASRRELLGRSMEVFPGRNFNQNLGIIFANGEVWNTMRQFTMRNLRKFGFGKSSSMENIIQKEIEESFTHLRRKIEENNGILRIDGQFVISVVNIVWSLATGERFNHEDPKLQELIRLNDLLFKTSNFVSNYTMAFPFIGKYFPNLAGKKIQEQCTHGIHEFFRSTIKDYEKHEHRHSDPQNFLEVFINQIETERNNPDTLFTEEQLIIILMDLFQAGSDSPAELLSFAILYLTLNPEVQTKLQQEIDRVIPKGMAPALCNKPSLIYTQATLYETMRLGDVIPIAAARRATEDFFFRGLFFRKGIDVMFNVHSVCTNKDLWGDPENFRPDRFIKNDGSLNNELFEKMLVFGHGKRFCIGDTLAMSTMFLFLASLIQQMKFQPVVGQPTPSTKQRLGVIMSPYPFDVLIEMRN